MTDPAAALPILEDGTLRVRMGQASDAAAVARYYSENRAALKPYEPARVEAFYTAEFWHVKLAVALTQFQRGQAASLFVFEPDDSTVIGTINFSGIVGYPLHGALLGYSLAHAQWGKRRMRRALILAISWSLEHFNLHRIAANHLPDNERSARLLAHLGFVREGHAADYLLIDGRWRDHVLTALTHRQWRAHDSFADLVHQRTGQRNP